MNHANKTANSDIAQILSKLKHISLDDNQDLVAIFKGYTHGKTGFIVQLTFVETVTDTTVYQWKNVSDNYQCEVDMDYNNRTVNLYFEQKLKKVKNKELIKFFEADLLLLVDSIKNKNYENGSRKIAWL